MGTLVKVKWYSTGDWLVLGISLLIPSQCIAAENPEQCRRVVIQGQVEAGNEWKHPIGQGWIFRLVPIKAGEQGYSGWDLVVDRVVGAGFPDALLLATPPYDSINQREVGTTFGVRSQDAIGWNPRSFRFLTDPVVFRAAQKQYFALHNPPEPKRHNREVVQVSEASKPENSTASPSESLIADIAEHSAAGQFRILEARLTPGTANALPYAQNWALQQRNTPHTITSTMLPTPYGKLDELRFEITLSLPGNWKTPKALQSAKCE
jgi:hypothetical protein